MRRTAIAIALLAVLPGRAAAQPAGPRKAAPASRTIQVTVVDVAGGMAYVEPGEEAGLVAGQVVTIGRARLKVVAVSSRGAALELGAARIAVGDRGSARVDPAATAATVDRMPAPRSLDAFRGQWHAAVLPATRQTPRHVPLGRTGASSVVRGALFAQTQVVSPTGGDPFVTGQLGARVSIDPPGLPVGLDADGALLLWAGDGLAGPDSVHRLGRVRELRLRYGAASDPRVALGRLRWASFLAGPLDGVRVSAPVGGVSLGAWGGVIPDEISGRPTTDASSFGAEVAYDRPAAPLRPRVALTAAGTTFDGALDERKLGAEASVEGERVAAGGHVEVASFPGEDPWNAPALELSAAGASVRTTLGRGHADLFVGARRPERSRRLAALLPPEWLCRPSPRPPGEVEPCADAPLRSEATLSTGWRAGRIDLSAGASGYHATAGDVGLEASGFAAAGVRDLLGRGRVEVDVDAGRIEFVDWIGGGGAVGAGVMADRLDVTARYHLTMLRYTGSLADELEHRVGARARLELASTELTADAELVRGGGADAVLGLFGAIWRLP